MQYVTKQEFEVLENRVAKLEASEPAKRKEERPTSTKEFMLSKKPKSEAAKAVCLIYFFETFQEDTEEGMSSNGLNKAFKDIKEKTPKNSSDVLSRCAAKGWIDKVDNKVRPIKWRLTNTGMAYVNGLGED